MRVLVVGGGGREHALAHKLAQSPSVEQIYCAPGNTGIAETAECVPIQTDDLSALADFAAEQRVDLIVVGPEAPLVAGLADLLGQRHVKVFGPGQAGAQLEGSKAFAKDLMAKHGIPTAAYRIFDDFEDARRHLQRADYPLVIKADGLAAGKGVAVCADLPAALEALRRCMVEREFSSAGDRVVIEDCLIGREVSLLAITDGETVLPLEPAQDYKRVYDGDTGPNTGGMGAYSPVPSLEPRTHQEIVEKLLTGMVRALVQEGIRYQGVLYVGVMLTVEGPKVLEYNVRFGDPETQAIIPRLHSDLAEILLAAAEGTLHTKRLEWSTDRSVTVVLASGGYPGRYETGYPITGLKEASSQEGVEVYHAGTALAGDQVVTAGGRVLAVSASGRSFREARDRSYAAAEKIRFKHRHFRTDISEIAIQEERAGMPEAIIR